MPDPWRAGGFGLYVHWPFCQSKCPYCDFNSHVSATVDQNRWKSAYCSEISRYGAETEGRVLDTVYFGGGTPSLMDPDLVGSILETIRATWRTSNSFEVTLETNPTSAESGRFQAYRDAGVNRVSVGIQALNDVDLRALGRLHTASEALKAFEMACGVFDRTSFDLIYARQNQTLSEWRAELSRAIEINTGHLSLYQLTVEDGTAFGKRFSQGKLPGLPNEDTAADMYFATQDMCGAAGLPAYEISNHAAGGLESRHNLIYWRSGDYIGIGPGAHGRISLGAKRYATETDLSPGLWLTKVETTGAGEATRSEISPADQGAEYLMMCLRLSEGLSTERHEVLSNSKIDINKINALVDLSFLTIDHDILAVTDKGRPVLNAIIRELLP